MARLVLLLAALGLVLLVGLVAGEACTPSQGRDAQTVLDEADRICISTQPRGQAEQLVCLSLEQIDQALPRLEAWRAARAAAPRGSSLGGGASLDAGPLADARAER